MEVRKVHPDRTLIELSPEETEKLRKALGRMTQSFTLMGPVIQELNDALVQATKSLRQLNRLDPAESRPEPDPEHVRVMDRHPFASPRGEIGRLVHGGDPVEPDGMEHGGVWPVPGPKGPSVGFLMKPADDA